MIRTENETYFATRTPGDGANGPGTRLALSFMTGLNADVNSTI